MLRPAVVLPLNFLSTYKLDDISRRGAARNVLKIRLEVPSSGTVTVLTKAPLLFHRIASLLEQKMSTDKNRAYMEFGRHMSLHALRMNPQNTDHRQAISTPRPNLYDLIFHRHQGLACTERSRKVCSRTGPVIYLSCLQEKGNVCHQP